MTTITSLCATPSRRRADRRGRSCPLKPLEHEVDFGCGFARYTGTRFALSVAFQHPAPPQHVFAHGKSGAGLLLVAYQWQMGVKQVVRLAAASGGYQLAHVHQHFGKSVAGHGPVGAPRQLERKENPAIARQDGEATHAVLL